MRYQVVDVTGRVSNILRREMGDLMANIFDGQGWFHDGDAFVVRDCLQEHGLQWSRDFYLKRMDPLFQSAKPLNPSQGANPMAKKSTKRNAKKSPPPESEAPQEAGQFNRAAFLSLVEGQQEAYAAATAIGERWNPPDGDYNVLLIEVGMGTYTDKKSGQQACRVCPTYQILDGDLEGRTFGSFYSTKNLEALKGFLASVLDDASDLPTALEELEALAEDDGTFMVVRVKTTTNAQGTFTNAYVQGVGGDEEAEETEDEGKD